MTTVGLGFLIPRICTSKPIDLAAISKRVLFDSILVDKCARQLLQRYISKYDPALWWLE